MPIKNYPHIHYMRITTLLFLYWGEWGLNDDHKKLDYLYIFISFTKKWSEMFIILVVVMVVVVLVVMVCDNKDFSALKS